MGLAASIIADSAELSLGYGKRLLTAVSDTDFACFAKPGGQTVNSNHPAFIYGHLSLYPSRVIKELGHDASSYEPTEQYNELFNASAKCQDDPQRMIYPSMDEIVERFMRSYEAAIAAVRETGDEIFHSENPNEKMRSKFGTRGAMHGFYLGGHVMMHMGQMSAWRRMMNLGAA